MLARTGTRDQLLSPVVPQHITNTCSHAESRTAYATNILCESNMGSHQAVSLESSHEAVTTGHVCTFCDSVENMVIHPMRAVKRDALYLVGLMDGVEDSDSLRVAVLVRVVLESEGPVGPGNRWLSCMLLHTQHCIEAACVQHWHCILLLLLLLMTACITARGNNNSSWQCNQGGWLSA